MTAPPVLSPELVTAMNLLPVETLRTHWFAVLAAFVAVNTLMYVVLSVGRMLPKPYLSELLPQRGRRAEDRSIWAGTRPPGSRGTP